MSTLTSVDVRNQKGRWCWLVPSTVTSITATDRKSFHDTLANAKTVFDTRLKESSSPTTTGTLLMLPDKVYLVTRAKEDVVLVERAE